MSRLIVCERSGRWSAGLDRFLSPDTPRTTVASLVLAEEALRATPHGFVVVEIAAAEVAKVFEWLTSVERRFPPARTAVAGELTLRQYEADLLEAGAVCCLWGFRRLRPLSALIERHLEGAPRAPVSLVDQIAAQLPWSDVAV
jgi:hypothetical protein